MEDGGERSVEVELLLEDRVEEGEVEDVSFMEGDSLFVGCHVCACGEVVGDRLYDSVEVF